jgi:hypothetical protein
MLPAAEMHAHRAPTAQNLLRVRFLVQCSASSLIHLFLRRIRADLRAVLGRFVDSKGKRATAWRQERREEEKGAIASKARNSTFSFCSVHCTTLEHV